jgi:hypothetical protein
LQSLHRKGTCLFIKSKLVRLGIPWLIVIRLSNRPVVNLSWLCLRGPGNFGY